MSANRSSSRRPTGAAFLVISLAVIVGFFGGKLARRLSPSPDSNHVAAAPARRAAALPASLEKESSDWQARWRQAASQSSGPTRGRALAKLLEELARTDPKRALDLAFAEGNWHLREQLRNAALRGWGATAPDAAADWALNHRLDVRMACLEAIFAGAAENPAEAVRVALRVCAADAEPAADYGHALISALIEKSGAFEAAAEFAAKVGTNRQTFLVDSAFYQWAQHRPQEALAAASKVTDSRIRGACLDGLFQGWAGADAKELAGYAQALPSGEERSRALNKALPHWATKDPAGALEWIGNLDPSPDLDDGVAAVARLPAFNQNAETALDWANNITDGAKRIMTKHTVFTEWAQRDYASAQRFLQSVKNPDERDMMLEVLNGMKSGG